MSRSDHPIPSNMGIDGVRSARVACVMDSKIKRGPQEMRSMARELRDLAATADLPGYAEKLIRAAEELEAKATAVERR